MAREPDLVIVAPATADLLARMAGGHADDLASTILLATDRPVLVAPAMNPHMWAHPATRRNVAQLVADGVHFVGPNAGEMAEGGEAGLGRMAEPLEIVAAAEALLKPGTAAACRPSRPRHLRADPRADRSGPLHRQPLLRQAGPCHRRRRGRGRRPGDAGLAVRSTIPDPAGVTTIHVETARQMLEAVESALPADIAIMAAAVADWRAAEESQGKIKKDGSGKVAPLALVQNPDILATVGRHHTLRPDLVDRLRRRDRRPRSRTPRPSSRPRAPTGSSPTTSRRAPASWAATTTRSISSRASGIETWPKMTKAEVAARLVARIAETFGEKRASR